MVTNIFASLFNSLSPPGRNTKKPAAAETPVLAAASEDETGRAVARPGGDDDEKAKKNDPPYGSSQRPFSSLSVPTTVARSSTTTTTSTSGCASSQTADLTPEEDEETEDDDNAMSTQQQLLSTDSAPLQSSFADDQGDDEEMENGDDTAAEAPPLPLRFASISVPVSKDDLYHHPQPPPRSGLTEHHTLAMTRMRSVSRLFNTLPVTLPRWKDIWTDAVEYMCHVILLETDIHRQSQYMSDLQLATLTAPSPNTKISSNGGEPMGSHSRPSSQQQQAQQQPVESLFSLQYGRLFTRLKLTAFAASITGLQVEKTSKLVEPSPVDAASLTNTSTLPTASAAAILPAAVVVQEDLEDHACGQPADGPEDSSPCITSSLDISAAQWKTFLQEWDELRAILLRPDANTVVSLETMMEEAEILHINDRAHHSNKNAALKLQDHVMFQADYRAVTKLLHYQQVLAQWREEMKFMLERQDDDDEEMLDGDDDDDQVRITNRELLLHSILELEETWAWEDHDTSDTAAAAEAGLAPEVKAFIDPLRLFTILPDDCDVGGIHDKSSDDEEEDLEHAVELALEQCKILLLDDDEANVYSHTHLQVAVRGLLIKWSESVLEIPRFFQLGYGGVSAPVPESAVDDDLSSWGGDDEEQQPMAEKSCPSKNTASNSVPSEVVEKAPLDEEEEEEEEDEQRPPPEKLAQQREQQQQFVAQKKFLLKRHSTSTSASESDHYLLLETQPPEHSSNTDDDDEPDPSAGATQNNNSHDDPAREKDDESNEEGTAVFETQPEAAANLEVAEGNKDDRMEDEEALNTQAAHDEVVVKGALEQIQDSHETLKGAPRQVDAASARFAQDVSTVQEHDSTSRGKRRRRTNVESDNLEEPQREEDTSSQQQDDEHESGDMKDGAKISQKAVLGDEDGQADDSSTCSEGNDESSLRRKKRSTRPTETRKHPGEPSKSETKKASTEIEPAAPDLKDDPKQRQKCSLTLTKAVVSSRKRQRNEGSSDGINQDLAPPRQPAAAAKPSDGKSKKVPFSEDEMTAIREGVKVFGVGHWKRIKLHDSRLLHRNESDIKDKYREMLRGGQA